MSFLLTSFRGKTGIRRYIGPKRIVLLLFFIALVFFIWNYYRTGSLSPAIIEQYRKLHPVGAVILFILIYAISVMASLPSLPLNLAAGFFWGGFVGGVFSAIGVTIGGWASFAAARWLIGQPLAKKFDNEWVSRIQDEFDESGWKFVAFARINPIIPTGPLNYLLGLTSLSHLGFVWVTLTFLLPPSIAVAYIGDTIQTFAAQHSGDNAIVKGILIVSAAVTFLVGIRFVIKIFKKRTDKL